MRDIVARFVRLSRELYRRRVPRVILAYAVAGWAAATLSNDLTELLSLPEWTPRLVLALVLLGFPIAVAVSWAFDVTRTGIVRTAAEPDLAPRLVLGSGVGGRVATVVILFAALALAAVTARRMLRSDDGFRPAERVAVIHAGAQNGTDPELADGLALLLATRLESAGWSVVDSRTLRAALRLPGEAGHVAARVGAGFYVLLDARVEEDVLEVRADLHRADDPAAVLRSALARDSINRVMTVIGHVGAQLAGADGDAGTARPDPVAVMPALFDGPPQHAHLADIAATLLSVQLEQAGWPTSDTRSLYGVVRQAAATSAGTASAQAARTVFASFFVDTRVEVQEGEPGITLSTRDPSVELTTSLYHVSDAQTPVESFSLDGRTSEFPRLVQTVARRLASAANVQGGASLRALPTESLDALSAYIAGERLFAGGHYKEAAEAFEEAIELDPAFALAYYRLSITVGWISEIGPQEVWVNRGLSLAIANGTKLTWRQRLLVEARRAELSGDYGGAERLYEWILAAHPEDYEANYQLAEIRFHNAPLEGRSALGSGANWQQALVYVRDDFGALMHWARLLALAGQPSELEAVIARALELEPEGERVLELQAILAFSKNDPALQQQTLGQLETEASRTIWLIATRVAIYARSPTGAERIIRLLLAPDRDAEARTLGHTTLAHLLLAQGRWREARAALRAARDLNPLHGLVFETVTALAPFLPAPSEQELEALRTALLETQAPPPTGQPITELTAHDSVFDRLRLYALGSVSLALGSENDANRFLSEIEGLGGPDDAIELGETLAGSLRTQIHLTRGAAAAAAQSWENFSVQSGSAKLPISPFYALTRERFLRALNMKQVGRLEEALRGFSTFGEVSVYDLPYLAPAHFHSGEILEQQGEIEAAATHYRRFLELWQDADPALSGMVQRARLRLSAANTLAAERALQSRLVSGIGAGASY